MVEFYIMGGTALVCTYSTDQVLLFLCAVLFHDVNAPVSSWVLFDTDATNMTIRVDFFARPFFRAYGTDVVSWRRFT